MLVPALYLALWKLADEHRVSQPSIFDLPQVASTYRRMQHGVVQLQRQGRLAEAENVARMSTRIRPGHAVGFHNQACMLALRNRPNAAIECLRRAIATGNYSRQLMRGDPDLTSLRTDPRFRRMLEVWNENRPAPRSIWTRPAIPQWLTSGTARVEEANTAWNPRQSSLEVSFRFLHTTRQTPIANTDNRLDRLLNSWHDGGTAAGNTGDLYDNRDAGHSQLNLREYPQLTPIVYGQAATAKNLHYGMQHALLFNAPTFGNSSSSVSGPLWRSNTRAMLCSASGPLELYRQYIGNHMYIYPEHRDYDPAETHPPDGIIGNTAAGDTRTDLPASAGSGDLFPANTPYVVTSQGSSGSDLPFLQAMLKTAAALRPRVKQQLRRSGTLMPTLQMLLRRNLRGINKDEDYLNGSAHPPVFSSQRLDVSRMVNMAHAIQPSSLPPMVQMRVAAEPAHQPGRDYFEASTNEVLFTTPCAIARIHRSTTYEYKIVIDASASVDLFGKPLKWHWRVLQGHAERVSIKFLNSQKSKAQIIVGHHTRFPMSPASALHSNRVDVGVFVHNGTYYSAPGFLSIFSLANEKRVYDDRKRIKMVDYAAPASLKLYVDPILTSAKRWRDVYSYDQRGRPTGWTRHRAGQPPESFTRDGLKITKRDALGRAATAINVQYVRPSVSGASAQLVQKDGTGQFQYVYDNEEDTYGRLKQSP